MKTLIDLSADPNDLQQFAALAAARGQSFAAMLRQAIEKCQGQLSLIPVTIEALLAAPTFVPTMKLKNTTFFISVDQLEFLDRLSARLGVSRLWLMQLLIKGVLAGTVKLDEVSAH